MAQLIAVNVGTPREATWAGIGRTSIAKKSVTGSVAVHTLGVAGDQISDTKHHGGIDQAVYAFVGRTSTGGPSNSANRSLTGSLARI